MAILYGAALVAILEFADTKGEVGILKYMDSIRNGDKLVHFIGYGILSLLASLSTFEAFPSRNTAARAAVCSLLLAIPIALEEYSQPKIPTRSPSLTDLLSGLLGVGLFAVVAVKIWGQRMPPAP